MFEKKIEHVKFINICHLEIPGGSECFVLYRIFFLVVIDNELPGEYYLCILLHIAVYNENFDLI